MLVVDWSQCWLFCVTVWHLNMVAGPSYLVRNVTEARDYFWHFWHGASLVYILLFFPFKQSVILIVDNVLPSPNPFSSVFCRVLFLGQSCSHCTPSTPMTWYVIMSVIITNTQVTPICQRELLLINSSLFSLIFSDLCWKSCRLDVQQQAQTIMQKWLKFYPSPIPYLPPLFGQQRECKHRLTVHTFQTFS